MNLRIKILMGLALTTILLTFGVIRINSAMQTRVHSIETVRTYLQHAEDFENEAQILLGEIRDYRQALSPDQRNRARQSIQNTFEAWRAPKGLDDIPDELSQQFSLVADSLESLFAVEPTGGNENLLYLTELIGQLETQINLGVDTRDTLWRQLMLETADHTRKNQRELWVFTAFMFALVALIAWILHVGYGHLNAFWTAAKTSEDDQMANPPETRSQLDELADDLRRTYGRLPEADRAVDIMRSITEGLLVISPDSKILSANKSIQQMLGYTHEELVGRPFTDIYVKLRSIEVHGFFRNNSAYREEELFKTKSGRVIPVRFSSSFLFDADMEVIGFVCIAKDITKEKQFEEELKKQNEWFKVTLSSIGDAVISTDEQGRVIFLNQVAETLTGWRAEDALQKPVDQVFQVIMKESREQERMPDLTSLKGDPQAHQGLERILIQRNRQEVAIDKTVAPIRDHEEHAIGMVVVFRDVSELQRAADELRMAKERAEAAVLAKDRFLANLSHEIRTPMNGIIGMTGLLLDSPLTQEQREYAELVRTSADSLLTLINDILDFSKIEAGKLELESIDFNLRSCIEEVSDLLAPRAHTKALEMPVLIHSDAPLFVKGDSGRLRQILLNLIGNAIKFTENGHVLVEASLGPAEKQLIPITFVIKDTGIGIHPSKLDRLFRPFSQVDASMSRKYGGTGLGLAICKQLVDAMGGAISVKSEPEEGAVFTFTLRFKPSPKKGSISDYLDKRLAGRRILTVDAHETNLQVLRTHLNFAGCEVTTSRHGDQVLELLDQAEFDLLIIDMHLLDTVIEELIAEIRRRRPDLKILITTTTTRRKEALGLARSYAHGCLNKPIHIQGLYDACAEVLGRKVKPMPTIEAEDRIKPQPVAKRVLIVEDNVVNQRVAARLLQKAGYRYDVVSNGLEALEAIARIHYDLVLMDCQMPEMDGFEATRRIRKRERNGDKRTPIVALTANALRGDREYCLEVGMDDYLAKPVRRDELYATLERHLNPA